MYSSPEKVSGEKNDYKSDLWSIGCILYELATDQELFLDDDEDALREAICGDNITFHPLLEDP